MNTLPAYLRNALGVYDARRSLGVPEGRALYSTAAGLANTLGITKDRAREIISAALKERAETSTRTNMGAL